MADDALPHSVMQGQFTLFGVTLHCHLLSNGQRIIEADDVEQLFAAMGVADITPSDEELRAFARWMRGLN